MATLRGDFYLESIKIFYLITFRVDSTKIDSIEIEVIIIIALILSLKIIFIVSWSPCIFG